MDIDRRAPLGTRAPRARKSSAGATAGRETPLTVLTKDVAISPALRQHVAARLGRALGKFAPHVERVTVRFRDLNGPRGGNDKSCNVKVVLSRLPSVVVEEQAETERVAFDRVAARTERAVRSAIDKERARLPRRKAKPRVAKPRVSARPPAKPAKSLLSRRVGRSAANLETALKRPEKARRDQLVDTAAPGVSADARKAGGKHTARRNTKRNMRGMVAALEDSLTGRPSRKSTRASANRSKQGAALTRRVKAEVATPRARVRQS